MILDNLLPKVSIVIPVYNGSDFLAHAIDSALSQTYNNIEILVINDGSNDDGTTERVATSYGDKIRYFSKPNGGVASALNMGISKMRGEYFSWLSHDDLYTKDKIEKEINALSVIGQEKVIIYSNYVMFTKDQENCTPIYLKGVSAENFRYWLTVENKLHGCTLLIPKTAFEKVGNFNENMRATQDYDLWFRMAKEFKFVHISELLIKSRSHAGQGIYKMPDIVLKECNNLYTNFILDLQPQEILLASGKPLWEGYIEIASSLFNRGYNEAGQLADRLARENNPHSYIVMWISSNVKYLINKFIFTTKRLLPSKIKNWIKKMKSVNRRNHN